MNPNLPAFKLVYTYNENGTIIEAMEVGALIGDDKVYQITYFAEVTGNYKKDLPITQEMINSLKFNVDTLTYENPNYEIKMQYPYNWSNITENGAPVGYNKKDHYDGIIFYSPIKGPYLINKLFMMVVGYDSVYGKLQPYRIILSQSSDNRTWIKTTKELSLDRQQNRILNTTSYSGSFIAKGQGYIPFNIDLEPLNLPDQFFVIVFVLDNFLLNGQMCLLNDVTDEVSVPPPIYLVSLSPNSIKDLRAGDEKDIQVKIQSIMNLPFQISLSTEKREGLNLNFSVDKLSGVPSGITTSNLHLKVLSNAKTQLYTIPIRTDISLTPVLNLNDTTSAKITKFTNFTLAVSPPLKFPQQIIEAWNGFGPAINGFVGVITAVIGIGGVIGGWSLRKFKSKKDNNEEGNYRKK